MTGITSSISALISSIIQIFTSILNTILNGVQSVAAVAGTLVKDVFDLASGLVGFLLGNIVIIGVLIAAFVGYTVYQQRQGKSLSGKKTA
ncbi:hypothetical protein MMC19_005491 [Ptychographa xylographoides]|nr:hypothetical protein [Ptychographa xylographoides]